MMNVQGGETVDEGPQRLLVGEMEVSSRLAPLRPFRKVLNIDNLVVLQENSANNNYNCNTLIVGV